VVVDRFFKKEIEDGFNAVRSVRIPNSNSNNPNFFQTSRKFLYFSDPKISVRRKVPVVRHSAFPNSKFQILDGAILEAKDHRLLPENFLEAIFVHVFGPSAL
jgi:hypothetical protein